MIVDLLDIFLFSLFCFLLGWKLREAHARAKLDKLITHVEIRNTGDEMIPIVIEQQDDSGFFVYDGFDNSFMAQGKTKKELEENLARRFPHKKFMASPENLREIGFDN